MKSFYTLSLFVCTFMLNAQTIITKWDFNSSSLTPTTGSGSVSLIGGTEENLSGTPPAPFVTGITNVAATDKAYNSKTYPLIDQNSGTAGAEFKVSTAGKTSISIGLAVRGSNTASKNVKVLFSTNGTTWVDVATEVLEPATFKVLGPYVLPSTADNQANFSFRLVTVFGSSNVYEAIGATSTYGPGGTIRFDDVFVQSGILSNDEVATLDNSIKISSTLLDDNLLISSDEALNVEFYNINGQLAKKITSNNQLINVSDLAKGIYILKIANGSETVTKKVIKK